ncbi:MAG: thiamine pyrophosphate-requiring protein [Pseudomonadota bacterium]
MKPGEKIQFKPETTAEAFAGTLAARGVDYLFANGGTDFAPIVEAYAKGQSLGWKLPQPVIVPHENMGVAMMHGYTMVSGRAQAMMVHVGLGTANCVNGIINAARQQIPMLLSAGRTPLTESGDVPGARNQYIHWAQEHFDQGGMLREFVKWDYELRHPEQVVTAVDRALAIARSSPQGPVYLTLPREILGAPLPQKYATDNPTMVAPAPSLPDPDAIEQLARMLGAAARPLLITANGGRSADARKAIALLAETFGIPVVHYRPRYLALPTEHPMQAGWDPHALLKDADLVLVVECDVPWIPAQGNPQPDAKVVHIGADPLFARYPLRGFRTDVALAGAAGPILMALLERAQHHTPSPDKLKARREQVAAEAQSTRIKARSGAAAMPDAITPKYLSACLSRIAGDTTVFVNEYPLLLEEMELRAAGDYYANPSSGGLGWGLGAALGAKLASPEKTVICTVGDGAYMFGNPTPAHYVSQAMGLPALFVIFNNARWAAVHRSTLAMYPKGHAAGMKEPPFATLEPSPRFEHVVQASGGHGERITEPKDVLPALERALKIVREEKRQALLNVCLEPSYTKTS